MDKLAGEKRKKIMTSIRSKDTNIELILRKELWRRNIRYRKNFTELPGKPDIVITKYKIAIFCDSEFWHGKTYTSELFKETVDKEFWNKKITRNIERDKAINSTLIEEGYIVLRFWGKDIEDHLADCINSVENALAERKAPI